jgi:anaerobic selenocysteine-containing dehydrogenase/NADPH-dependent glutamate synthase beta subunit-like oxidoreductase/NAD-dependent dihydropyrimidine dehydrogenase PreA subunit
MAFVVTQSCIGNKHTNCVDVCPVEAFREGPEMLFIDPETCIDCNACVAACPEGAIFPLSMVPQDQQSFIKLNAERAKSHPVIRESIQAGQHAASPLARVPSRFAIIGSGPSGFYTAEALLKQMPAAQVDMFERLPTPFGLVRYGVAPDHPRIKSVTAGFERIADLERFRFFGNVQIGRDLTSAELRQYYHGVIYATGGSRSRPLNLPGAEGGNIFGSSNFVGWYNGHPDDAALAPKLSGSTAVIIGMGNVALDIARLLVLPTDELAKTDIADHALQALVDSGIEEVRLLARRGPVQAAFTPKELEQLMAIPGLQLLVDPADLVLDDATTCQLEQPDFAEARQNLSLLREIAGRPQGEGKRIRFMFYASPVAFSASNGQVVAVQARRTELVPNNQGELVARPADQALDIPATLVVHAIGYQGAAIDKLPFDLERGVIHHEQGRIHGDADHRDYVAGWIKRGASGVIGSNRQCATESVQRLIEDLGSSLPAKTGDISELLAARKVETVSTADWRLLDQHEQTRGRAEGRIRHKVVDIAEMLAVIRDAKARQAGRAKLPVKTHYRACTLCEAMCGVVIETQGEQILSIIGDVDDPHSEGHICPKGYALQDLHNDPDRLRTPLEKVNGQWLPIDWDTALDKVAAKLVDIQRRHGTDSIAAYWGNPSSHNLGLMMASSALRKAIGTRNISSAASLDQMPHQLVSYLMFGHSQLFTIPDIDRTDYMLMLGANPAASNGSLMTAGDVLKRLERIRERGGKVVLIDPRRTESARYVDQHLFIRPATDAFFLLGLIRHVLDKGLTKPGHLREMADNWGALEPLFDGVSLEQVSARCGVAVEDIKRIAEDFATAKSAVCYGRMGVSTQSYGTLNHWLMLVLNILTGNLDSAGGMMFTTPAFNKAQSRAMGSFNSYQSRVRGLPEFDRYFPAATIAEEMLTPGEGQVRGFVCVAGNPVLSTPNGRQMDEALGQLEFMVSIDFYLNETSRHADIILPPTGPLEHEQYDIVFNMLAVRNLARFSDPVFQPPEGTRCDWDIVQGLAQRIESLKNPDAAPPRSLPTPEQILDHGLKTGPYGQGFSEYNHGEPVEHEEALSIEVLKRYPHGLDLGPMRPSFPGYLFTPDQRIRLTPPELVADLARASAELRSEAARDLMLIGRRDLRTNNSWMHNSQRLVKGKDRCALLINTVDAERLGLASGKPARITSRTGELQVTVQVSDDIMPGVVCLPHGWGHDREGVELRIAQSNPGINVNDITDDQVVDALSGNAVLNGIPVSVVAA